MSLIALGCQCEPDCPPISGTPGPPGPVGPTGLQGPQGIDGVNAFGIVTAPFVMPAVGTQVNVEVDPAEWATIGQVVYVQGVGYFQVADTSTLTTMVLINLGYPDALNPGVSIGTGIQVAPAGMRGAQGPPWVLTQPLAINLGGTAGATPVAAFDNLSPLQAPGEIIAFDGSHNVAVTASGPDMVLVSDFSVPAGVRWVNESDLRVSFDEIAPTTTAGDLIVFNGTANVRLPAPTVFGMVLNSDPQASVGLSWQQPKSLPFIRIAFAQTPIVLNGTEALIGIQQPSGGNTPIHVVLAPITNWRSSMLVVKDESGVADHYPITVTTSDGTKIQGQDQYVMDIPWGKLFFYSDGTQFYVL